MRPPSRERVKPGQRVSMSSIAFDVGVTRQPGAFGEHPRFEFVDQRRDPFLADRKPLLETIDLALDREDRGDAADRFNGEWRFAQIGQLEEVAPTMAPACRLGDRARFALGVIEIAKPCCAANRMRKRIASSENVPQASSVASPPVFPL